MPGHLRRGHATHAFGGNTLQRIAAAVVGHDRQTGAAREMAAHRLSHHAKANEPDGGDRPQGNVCGRHVRFLSLMHAV